MFSGWDVEKTKAADIRSQLDRVVRNKTIYMKVSAGMADVQGKVSRNAF